MDCRAKLSIVGYCKEGKAHDPDGVVRITCKGQSLEPTCTFDGTTLSFILREADLPIVRDLINEYLLPWEEE